MSRLDPIPFHCLKCKYYHHQQPLTERTKLIEDLKIHQVELETQTEELYRAQREVQESRDRYRDLYDYAPVAYVTLEKDGRIVEANLTACRLLGLEEFDPGHSGLFFWLAILRTKPIGSHALIRGVKSHAKYMIDPMFCFFSSNYYKP